VGKPTILIVGAFTVSIDRLINVWNPYNILLIDDSLDKYYHPHKTTNSNDFLNYSNDILIGMFDCFVYKPSEDNVKNHRVLSQFFLKTLKNSIFIWNSDTFDSNILKEFDSFFHIYYNFQGYTVICRSPLDCYDAETFYQEILSHQAQIACICPTYKRPSLLADSIVSFLEQTYRNKKLYIVNDDWQGSILLPFECKNIIVENHNTRFASLSDKSDYLRELAQGDLCALWTDDDLYFPWRLRQTNLLHQANAEDVVKGNSALFQASGEISKQFNNLESTATYKMSVLKNKRYTPYENLNHELELLGRCSVVNNDYDPYYWLLMRWTGVNYHVSGHGGTHEAYLNYANLPCEYPHVLALPTSDIMWQKIYLENKATDDAQKTFTELSPWMNQR
jgi:hypothetical protein